MFAKFKLIPKKLAVPNVKIPATKTGKKAKKTLATLLNTKNNTKAIEIHAIMPASINERTTSSFLPRHDLLRCCPSSSSTASSATDVHDPDRISMTNVDETNLRIHDLTASMDNQFANTNASIASKDEEYSEMHRDFNMRLEKFE